MIERSKPNVRILLVTQQVGDLAGIVQDFKLHHHLRILPGVFEFLTKAVGDVILPYFRSQTQKVIVFFHVFLAVQILRLNALHQSGIEDYVLAAR